MSKPIYRKNIEKLLEFVNDTLRINQGVDWEIKLESWSALDGSGTAYQLRHSKHNTYLSTVLNGKEMYAALYTTLKMINAISAGD